MSRSLVKDQQKLLDLGIDAFRYADFHGVSHEPSEHCQGNAGVAGGRFDDGLSGSECTGRAGALEDAEHDPVLDAAGGVLGFELGEKPYAGVRRERAKLDERRVAYQAPD